MPKSNALTILPSTSNLEQRGRALGRVLEPMIRGDLEALSDFDSFHGRWKKASKALLNHPLVLLQSNHCRQVVHTFEKNGIWHFTEERTNVDATGHTYWKEAKRWHMNGGDHQSAESQAILLFVECSLACVTLLVQ